MNGDYMPISHHPRKIDPEQIKKIKEGAKKADEIRKKADAHHHQRDVPAAEEQLLKDLDALYN